jgi:protein-S-isoprenylcysteine O-methyltransferase Ste14
MTTKILKCAKSNSCQKSLVFRFLQTARWVALLLLCGVGVGLTLLDFYHSASISWVFLGVCVFGGVMLFWVGRCLMQSECSTVKRTGACRQAHALIRHTSVGQTIVRS